MKESDNMEEPDKIYHLFNRKRQNESKFKVAL